MIEKPRWKASLYVDVVDDENIVLLDETESTVVTGKIFAKLVALLDGRHTLTELADRLDGEASPPELYYALTLLQQQGCIVEGGSADEPGVAAFWHSLGVEMPAVSQRLAQASVGVTAVGSVPADGMISALEAQGIRVGDEDQLRIVLTDDYLQVGIDEINRSAVATGRPWMLVKPVGTIVWLGPIFRSQVTGCWECLAQRLRGNRQMESFLLGREQRIEPLPTSVSALPPYVAAAYGLAATEVAKALVLGRSDVLDGTVVTFDTLTLNTEKHTLTKRPQCPACGTPGSSNGVPAPIVLASSRKRYRADGGHRTYPPEVTFRKYREHISNITGVVSSLKDLTEDPEAGLIYSYSAGHNFALLGHDLTFVLQNLRGRSGGKGATDIQAKASAVCEAIERYSGVFIGDEIARQSTYEHLGDAAIHPNRLMNFSADQYENRLAWNERHRSGYHKVPEMFDQQRTLSWTPVRSMNGGAIKYVPTAFCYYGHPELKKYFFCTCDANGNAAGNSLEEAILQGFMELVERDSVALWWYNRVARPGVDLDSFSEPYFDLLREYYGKLKRELWVIDITSDLGIPAFAAISRRTDNSVEDIVLGFGAHFDPRLAIMRSITEVNQFMPAVSKRDADGNTVYWFPDPEAIEWWKRATVESERYLVPSGASRPRVARDYVNRASDDLKSDVELCIDIAHRNGLETFVLDQTRPDIGLRVVKVIVPGLRHFWKRFGPGRLYDKPVELGWTEHKRTEDELNPTGIFF